MLIIVLLQSNCSWKLQMRETLQQTAIRLVELIRSLELIPARPDTIMFYN